MSLLMSATLILLLQHPSTFYLPTRTTLVGSVKIPLYAGRYLIT